MLAETCLELQISRYRLALVVIARDEAASIGRCLRSAAALVDTMLVLDTGSTDDTASIAEEIGASVYHYTWKEDFAAARNAALDLVTADWNLVLDADEWIEDGGGQLGPGVLGKDNFIGLVPVTSEFDLQGNVETATSWLPRILPATVRYEGRIHEQPVSDLPRGRVALNIRHDGYRREQLTRKKGRNQAILLDTLKEKPGDGYLLYQLGKDYEIYQDYSNAVNYFTDALQHTSITARYRHDLIVRLIVSLKQSKQYERAIQFSEDEMKNWQHSPDFFFTLGDLLLDWATLNPEKALQELLPMIESCWTKCIEIGDQPELEGSVKGHGSHLAAHNLAVLHESLGDSARAEHYHKLAAAMRASN